MKGHRGKTLLGLAVTAVLLWWTVRDVSFAEVYAYLREADLRWLGGAVVVATLGFVPRAARWDVLLLPAHGGTGFGSRFGAVCIGAMANNILPARLGEFARAYGFSRVEPVGMSPAFASLVAERTFDGLVLAAFLAGALALPGSPLAAGSAGAETVRELAVGAAVLFGLATAVLWLMVRFPERLLRLFEHTIGRILSPDLTDRGVEILSSFTRGLGALHDPWIFVRALAWTAAVWLTHAASIWMGFLAFDIGAPGPAGAIFLQAVIGFAVAVPSSPGFFGPFEAASRLGLGLYGVAAAQAVSFAVAYHVLTFIPVTLLGFWYVHRIGLRWAEVERSEELVGSAVEDADAAGGVPAGTDGGTDP